MTVVTRFAPSPTGFLHIGGARTALFNWLFARHHGGRFLLRVEDTDRLRSTDAAIAAIFDGLQWLGLTWDEAPVFQSQRADRHAAVVRELLDRGMAYRCFATPEELTEMREKARAAGRPVRYDGRWRDRDPATAPEGIDPVVRLRAPQSGATVIDDLVQGPVSVDNVQLDDMILLRADGTPTYMLAVVVDDHDMHVTHVIRGDDHLTNAFRQHQIYAALGWPQPLFAHIPLIHGGDGAKLSKRHGALGVDAYRDMGFLPEALCNYLLRLGWSHGDDEIISRDEAIAWFDLDAVGRSAARFDLAKLTSLNAHYIRLTDERTLADSVLQRLQQRLDGRLSPKADERIRKGLPGLKERAKTIVELADNAMFYAMDPPLDFTADAARFLAQSAVANLSTLGEILRSQSAWTSSELEGVVRAFASAHPPLKLKDVAQPLRAALTGSTVSPPIFEVMEVLGPEETLGRIGAVVASAEGKLQA
ncbi:glutamate--tRNA ligase [Defluviicoccus vanus]|uniref:Glutamate--tRNA ligase n=1 Tax=Defluviicoccus vanus TaxID=111831 RepID=A0A7H1N5I9_9PROT|nr:glutamate--tRNA ligase [Defluviicoccus vanus]QNT70975.1 glutamate--tRNA ligase [Defluviicoccus vanus]